MKELLANALAKMDGRDIVHVFVTAAGTVITVFGITCIFGYGISIENGHFLFHKEDSHHLAV